MKMLKNLTLCSQLTARDTDRHGDSVQLDTPPPCPDSLFQWNKAVNADVAVPS